MYSNKEYKFANNKIKSQSSYKPCDGTYLKFKIKQKII